VREYGGKRVLRGLALLFVGAAVVGASGAVVSAERAPYCQSSQIPRFQLGFATLQAELGATMGDAVECEHQDAASGDTVQGTSTGLAVYRDSTNTPTFTDGYRHWALTSAGLTYWEGAETDPPPGDFPAGAEPLAPETSTSAEPDSLPLLGATAYAYPVVDPPVSDVAPWCLPANPGCGQEPWWMERDQPQQSRLVQYRFVGPGLVTEERFAEAIRLLWQWPEGKFLLREAAAYGVGIVNWPDSISGEVFGAYHPQLRLIRVTGSFAPAPTWMLASVLAHELKHAADHKSGARQAGGYADCIATEQVAYEVENRFMAWLGARFQGLPSPGLAATRLLANDVELYRNLHEIATSPDVDAMAEEDYRDTCST
jgi:hypothetical protein